MDFTVHTFFVKS